MTLEEVSYVGQAVAAFAVLVSLAAVYGQLRQTNNIARADLTHSVWLQGGQMNLSLYDTPEKADLMHRALLGTGSLTEPEKLRMQSVLGVAMGIHEAAFNLRKRGLIENNSYTSLESVARLYLQSPIVRKWWARLPKKGRDPDYVALLDAMAAEANQGAAQSPR